MQYFNVSKLDSVKNKIRSVFKFTHFLKILKIRKMRILEQWYTVAYSTQVTCLLKFLRKVERPCTESAEKHSSYLHILCNIRTVGVIVRVML